MRNAALVLLCAFLAVALQTSVAAQVQPPDPQSLVVPATDLGPRWSQVSGLPNSSSGVYGYTARYRNDTDYAAPREVAFNVLVIPNAEGQELLVTPIPGLDSSVIDSTVPYTLGDGFAVRLVSALKDGSQASAYYGFRVGSALVDVTTRGRAQDVAELDSQALQFAKLQEQRLRTLQPQPLVVTAPPMAAAPTVVTGSAAATPATSPPVPREYRVVELGTPEGLTPSSLSINDAGQVAGTGFGQSAASPRHALLWVNAEWTDLGSLGGRDAEANAISSTGTVVGGSRTQSGQWHAYIWQDGQMVDLGTLESGTYSRATGINSAGQVVGSSTIDSTSTAPQHAVLWQNGTITDLGTLGGTLSSAADINAAGQVTGNSSVTGSRPATHAFLWEAGVMRDLGTLGGHFSNGIAINASGAIVGTSAIPGLGEPMHGFLWNGTSMGDVGTLGGSESSAKSINSGGQIVGEARLSAGGTHAFLWEHGTLLDLNSRIASGSEWELTSATGINDSGQIVGIGLHNRVARGFMLVAVEV